MKKYSQRKVSEADLNKIFDAVTLSASSAGMQPYRLFVISNGEQRKQLREGSFNSQIEEASHLVVFAAFENITRENIDAYISFVASERNVPVEQLADFRNALESSLLSRKEDENFVWAAKQAYLALGTALAAAAELKIDSTPMEGFDPAKLDGILGLKNMGLKSVVLLALGYRDETNDVYAKMKKVRLPRHELVSVV